MSRSGILYNSAPFSGDKHVIQILSQNPKSEDALAGNHPGPVKCCTIQIRPARKTAGGVIAFGEELVQRQQRGFGERT